MNGYPESWSVIKCWCEKPWCTLFCPLKFHLSALFGFPLHVFVAGRYVCFLLKDPGSNKNENRHWLPISPAPRPLVARQPPQSLCLIKILRWFVQYFFFFSCIWFCIVDTPMGLANFQIWAIIKILNYNVFKKDVNVSILLIFDLLLFLLLLMIIIVNYK